VRKLRSLFIVGLSLAGCALSVFAPSAFAVTQATQKSASNSGQALEISPPVITLSGNPGQIIKMQISLRDISNGSLFVSGQINDFVAAGEDGTPKILLNDDTNNPYSLKSWVNPLPNLLMVPKQIILMPVTITIPANASPGGHYGVVRFTATPPELHGTGVSLSASLGSLVLITVNGKVKESLSIQELSINYNGKTGTIFESTPLNFVERLKNTGNTHEQPIGQVVITDMFGKKIAAVNVNLPPRNVLPQSIRKFSEPLDSTVIGNKRLFGHYNAKLSVVYGADKQVITSSLAFWVIPYRLIAGAIVVLIGGFLGLRFFIKRYNRSIISKAQSTQTKKPKK
jgi:hypothetical protein